MFFSTNYLGVDPEVATSFKLERAYELMNSAYSTYIELSSIFLNSYMILGTKIATDL